MTEDRTILLDRKTRAHRTGDIWAVQRLQPNGKWDMVKIWKGNRRSLIHWCEDNQVQPSREAEAQLALIPETTGFRDRT